MSKTTLKDRYPDEFDRARDTLVLAQAKLAAKASKWDRKGIDTLLLACGNMHLRQPRGFRSLIDACGLLAEICGHDEHVKPLLRQFWDIVDRINDRERVRKSLVLVEGGNG